MSYMLKLKVVYSYVGFMKGRNRNARYVGRMNESSFLWFIFPTKVHSLSQPQKNLFVCFFTS